MTPVIHLNPRFAPPEWESTGSIDDVVAVAQAADRLGYDWITASEHIAIPQEAGPVRGGRYWDQPVTLGYLAACTDRIALMTHMLVLGYRHPLEVVKRYGTLDVISGGRLILGVGVGSLEPEFRLLGRPFDDRGDRGDDAIRAVRASWGNHTPEYAGSHFRFDGVVVEPAGLPRVPPIWVGGRTRRSLRRAIALGDGWMPFRLLVDELRAMLDDPEIQALRAARSSPLELTFAPEPPLDPIGDPAGTAKTVRLYQAIGATGLSLRFDSRSRAHYIEQLEAMQRVIRELPTETWDARDRR